MILWFIETVFAFITILDLWLMGKYELRYWEMLKIFSDKYPELTESAKKLKDEASSAVSIGMFAFWYAMIGLALNFIAKDSTEFWETLGAIIFLHWAGKEDLQYFILDLIVQWLPESWWITRKWVTIIGKRRLPKSVPWMIVSKKIWILTIPMWWVRLFTGNGGSDKQNVKFWRFSVGVIVAELIVLTIKFYWS
jgi:hypothetical protein